MANTVKLKRSAVQGKAPSTTDLALGEVAINTHDGKLFLKKDQGGTEGIVEVGARPDIITSAKVINEDTAIASGLNALGINDVQVADGVTVEVPENSVWITVG